VDDGHCPCRKHLFGDAPHQVCPKRWVAVSLQSPASPPSQQVSGIISGGSPAQSHKEGVNCPLGAYGVDAFSGCLRAEPKLQPRSFSSLPARRLTLQESAPILSYRWRAGACHLRVSLPLEREWFDKTMVPANKFFLNQIFV
jgi:hypothetical protein